MKIYKIPSKKTFFLLSCAFTLLFIVFMTIIYYRHATTFSFVDEYTNIVAGYFMNNGRDLYADIFFHHQMMMPFISSSFQSLTHPESLYQLILHHRLLVILFALIMNLLLIYRFRYVGIGFVLFFEPLKYYLFGNLFLAESFVIYPLVYLLGLVWETASNKKISLLDLVIGTLFTWFVIFMREPYVPLALIMYGFLLWKVHKVRQATISIVLLGALSTIMLLLVPLKDFIFQVLVVNIQYVIPSEIDSNGKFTSMLISFFYPLYMFIDPHFNFYKVILVGLDLIFLSTLNYLIYKGHARWRIAMILILLAIANIRWVPPSTNFYVAYHATVWFGMFCFVTFLFIKEVYQVNKKIAHILLISALALFLGMMLYPKSYLWETVNREESFTNNYGRFYTNGNIINILSSSEDTIFIDQWDSLVYWQADRDISYQYAMYYPVTSAVPEFREERRAMFQDNPPDFYYTDCGKKIYTDLLPLDVRSLYIQLHYAGKPTCLYVKKTKVNEITEEQRSELNKLDYSIPKL